ncbi:ParM/StbA family protein [Pseudomonas aeruginosa]
MQQKVVFVGVDDGHQETKLIASSGFKLNFPSRAQSGLSNRISISGSKSNVFDYSTNDGMFSVGDIAVSEVTAYDDYPFSAQNRVLVAHGLRQGGFADDVVIKMVSGLPLKRFYKGGKPNKPEITLKRKNLMLGDVKALDGVHIPQVVSHDVISEGVAAWIDYIMIRDAKGKLDIDLELAQSRIAVIDIGGRTLDIAVIKDWELDFSRSTTEEIGMISIANEVSERIYHQYKGVEATDAQLDTAIKTGVLKLWGEEHDVTDFVHQANKMVVNSIQATIKACLKRSHDIDRVIITGGTSKYLEAYLKGWFPNQVMSSDPTFANAYGMLKFAEYTMGGSV